MLRKILSDNGNGKKANNLKKKKSTDIKTSRHKVPFKGASITSMTCIHSVLVLKCFKM